MDKIPNVDIKIDVDGNKIYDDACSSVLHPTSQALGLVPRAIRAAFAPLEKWLLHREYAVKEVEALLESKLQNVNPETIVTPEPYVAVPALQSVSYSMDSEHLRNMYANLLSKAMLLNIKNDVHPAFIEIIKQLSPNDAILLKEIVSFDGSIPAASLSICLRQDDSCEDEDSFKKIPSVPIITPLQIDNISEDEQFISLDNLNRLGIINLSSDALYDDSLYDFIQNTELFYEATNYSKELEENGASLHNICTEKKSIGLTSFGKIFCNICINDL